MRLLWTRTLVLSGLLSFTLVAAPAVAAPMIVLDLNDQGPSIEVMPGEVVDVEVFASEISTGSDGLGMFGFGFSLLFEETALSSSDPVLGPLWSGTGFDDQHNDPGNVGLTSNRFFEASGPSGDGILLGTLQLTAGNQLGTFFLTPTHFTGVGDNNLFDGTILDTAGSGFFGDGGSITVVPEPGSGLLLLSALTGLALGRRNPRRAAPDPEEPGCAILARTCWSAPR